MKKRELLISIQNLEAEVSQLKDILEKKGICRFARMMEYIPDADLRKPFGPTIPMVDLHELEKRVSVLEQANRPANIFDAFREAEPFEVRRVK